MTTEINTADLLIELQMISNDHSSRFRALKNSENTKSKTKKDDHGCCESDDGNAAARFLNQYTEDSNMNQYWYSEETIQVLCNAIVEAISTCSSAEEDNRSRVAFLSTPSLYFALPPHTRANSFLFDYDRKWENDRGFIFYDLNEPEQIPSSLLGSFQMIVIDPPFINKTVWRKMAVTANALLGPKERFILGTTVAENSDVLFEMFGAKPVAFSPSIPNLVYQYLTFANFSSPILANANVELMM